ncbi:MAG: leucine-rich repeat domain-containing protein, partial [Candidatus Thorarchaeota archaeon]
MEFVIYRDKEYKVKKNKLSLKKLGIADINEIEGLGNLSNLEELDLSNNKITVIKGLDNLADLKTLNLSKNRISEIKGLKA